MKKRTKGILAFAFFGGLMLTSGVVIGIPGLIPEPDDSIGDGVSGDPNSYSIDEQIRFCESSTAKTTPYITEYKISTWCVQPLAIFVDDSSNVWFTQTNTGGLGMFDPKTETFTDYPNPQWTSDSRSMMWGIDSSSDGNIWFTDDSFDSIWQFDPVMNTYTMIPFPVETRSLPQKLSIINSSIIINDFTGAKLALLDIADAKSMDTEYSLLPSPVENSFTSDVALDSNGSLWFTNWVFQKGGVLSNIPFDSFRDDLDSVLTNSSKAYPFPPGLTTPNGLVADKNDNIWIVDTSSNFFFKFDPIKETFTRYVTSIPTVSTYGNVTGVIVNPVSRPYWIDVTDDNLLVFNEQTANRIGVFDPESEVLVEYLIPSMNPFWADCQIMKNCGLAQVFDFAIDGDLIWFTEWVENNIGVVDTSIPLPYTLNFNDTDVVIPRGTIGTVSATLEKVADQTGGTVSPTSNIFSPLSDIVIIPFGSDPEDAALRNTINYNIVVSDTALIGKHRVLLGGDAGNVSVSQFITITVT